MSATPMFGFGRNMIGDFVADNVGKDEMDISVAKLIEFAEHGKSEAAAVPVEHIGIKRNGRMMAIPSLICCSVSSGISRAAAYSVTTVF
ncbi:hypothetical protein LB543_26825 [Mesorhizobium sp. ESP7-2]|nr:hypothetical protein [Mesorhizobium sp. ESP7-2]